jgi:3-methyladenine DNA glycosylase/8-oxoguanine DNA glycosylase
MRPGHPSSLYEYLVIGIVLQNATVRRSIQMFSALLAQYGALLEYDRHSLWCFWAPGGLGGVTEEALRTLKVGYRAKSIKRIDDAFAQGLVDELALRQCDRDTNAGASKALWCRSATVLYLLFDVFHHWDFFNYISLGSRRSIPGCSSTSIPNPAARGGPAGLFPERFGAYKQLAVHYIWRLWWQRKRSHLWLES